MKKILYLTVLLCLATTANAADEKIDPKTYICAELVAASTSGQPPIYEGLQLDGYLAGMTGATVADPDALQPLLVTVSDACAAKPAEKALDHWREMRKHYPFLDDGPWRADKTSCGDYAANPDDGSGFVIWLDAYQRAESGKAASVFESQKTLDHFLEVCKSSPRRLMIDVMRENAK